MEPLLRRLAVTLAIMAILVGFVANIRPAFPANGGRRIDLYTQKVPFDGKGANQSSDAYQPEDLVMLFALVTYNDVPVVNRPVAFQITNPPNAFQSMSIAGGTLTDGDGIAQFTFTIPFPTENAEQIVFGTWSAIATVNIASQVAVDLLTFRVGWIIQITGISTLNATLHPQTIFQRQEQVILDLTVENIALTHKTATVVIVVKDAENFPIIQIQHDDLVFQSGQTHVSFSSQIPAISAGGTATITATALTAPPTQGGALYSPSTLSYLDILAPPIPQKAHDVAVVGIGVSSSTAYAGIPIDIAVEVANLGDFTETFNVTAYYDAFKIDTKRVMSLSPHLNLTVSFRWDTFDVVIGNHVVWALVNYVPEEANLTNNVLTYGNVTLLAPPSYLLSVASSPVSVWFAIGGRQNTTPYSVTLRLGTYTIVMPESVVAAGKTYSFRRWEDGSTNPSRTVFLDRNLSLTAYYEEVIAGQFWPEWFNWLLLLLLLLLVLVLIIWYYRRRRKNKQAAASFQSGWAAWFYCRNPTTKLA